MVVTDVDTQHSLKCHIGTLFLLLCGLVVRWYLTWHANCSEVLYFLDVYFPLLLFFPHWGWSNWSQTCIRVINLFYFLLIGSGAFTIYPLVRIHSLSANLSLWAKKRRRSKSLFAIMGCLCSKTKWHPGFEEKHTVLAAETPCE